MSFPGGKAMFCRPNENTTWANHIMAQFWWHSRVIVNVHGKIAITWGMDIYAEKGVRG